MVLDGERQHHVVYPEAITYTSSASIRGDHALLNFWDLAHGATLSRATVEGWTAEDCEAAMYQLSFLRFTSHPDDETLHLAS